GPGRARRWPPRAGDVVVDGPRERAYVLAPSERPDGGPPGQGAAGDRRGAGGLGRLAGQERPQPRSLRVTTSRGIALIRDAEETGGPPGDEPHDGNPHVWLDPENA